MIHFRRFKYWAAPKFAIRGWRVGNVSELYRGRYVKADDKLNVPFEMQNRNRNEMDVPTIGCSITMIESRGICGTNNDFVEFHSTSRANFHFSSCPTINNNYWVYTCLDHQHKTNTSNDDDECCEKSCNYSRSKCGGLGA